VALPTLTADPVLLTGAAHALLPAIQNLVGVAFGARCILAVARVGDCADEFHGMSLCG
jgi:hypothetical protein